MRPLIVPFLAVPLLSGCYTVSHWPTCEETAGDIGDDDVTPVGTATDLLASAVGVHDVDGQDEDGAPVDVTVTVARGDGSAQWVDSEAADQTSRGPGLIKRGDVYLDIAVMCDDALQVPVDVHVVAADAGVDWSVTSSLSLKDRDGVEPTPEILAEEDFAASGLPLPADREDGDWTDEKAYLTIYFHGDGTSEGRVGWEGTLEGDDTVEDAALDLVTW